MKRTSSRPARSKGRRGFAWTKLVANPVAPVLIGLAIVLGVGFYVMRDATPVSQADSQTAGSTSPASGTPKPESAPASTPTGGSKAPESSTSTTQKPAGTSTSGSTGQTEAAKTTVDPAVLAARGKIDRSGAAAETMLITLYFSDGLKNGMSLQPVEIKAPLTVSRLRATTEQLLQPPQDLKLYNSIPAGTKIGQFGVNFDKATGVATVDLTAEAGQITGSAAVNELIASFVYSLTELKDVTAVQLWIEGKPALLDGYEWSKPVSRADLAARNGFVVEPVIKYSGN